MSKEDDYKAALRKIGSLGLYGSLGELLDDQDDASLTLRFLIENVRNAVIEDDFSDFNVWHLKQNDDGEIPF